MRRRSLSGRHIIFGTASSIVVLQALVNCLSFYYNPTPSVPYHFPGRVVVRHAEAKEVQDEPDLKKAFAKVVQDGLGLSDERPLTVRDRITPVDRWFGWDKHMIASRSDDDPFVDSSDALNYVTVELKRPLGIEFVENTIEEGSGVMVGNVEKGSNAWNNGLVQTGYHLITANDVPVYGLSFDDAIQPILDSEGSVKLTFFAGDAVYFYGEFRPSQEWLSGFLEFLASDPDEEDQ
eukprot:TRINITY_DN64585_c0_g1_i1.p1 TRINITY_DN64585_c0_g1~~TRINITY_DN64585_c0_g1_i1.p1  ORF type:complete len:235 (-),score=38.33 TRINITY_DN64585_c0_g1_i1:83-787(-)